jgi:hypothetical protein
MLGTISLPLGVSNVLLGVYVLVVLISFKKENFQVTFAYLLPITLFLWALLSLFWTIDIHETTAVSKQITLLIIPILFGLQPVFNPKEKQRIFNYFSWSMVGFAVFYLLKAIFRFIMTKDTNVFFYHELVTLKVNAIYVSFFFAVAFLNLYRIKIKSWQTKMCLVLLLLMVVLLSSKNILLVLLFLIVSYHLFFSVRTQKTLLWTFGGIILAIVILFSVKQVRDRFLTEFQTETVQNHSKEVKKLQENGIRVVAVHDAWQQKSFTPNDFFSGTAFRVYQLRVFKELLHEEPIFWFGFGFNASACKVQQKSVEHNVFQGSDNQLGYGSLNFHNQYIQYFAELGIVGLILILLFVGLNLKNAWQQQDFLHFAFAILCISLFLTECLFWRQRGVVFVVLMYCLFNQKKVKKSIEITTIS